MWHALFDMYNFRDQTGTTIASLHPKIRYHSNQLTTNSGYATSNERGSADVKYQWKACVWKEGLRTKTFQKTTNTLSSKLKSKIFVEVKTKKGDVFYLAL